jgi:hypothetical protein
VGLGTVCRLADLQISSLLPDAIGLLKAVYSQSFRAVSCFSNTHSLRTYTSSAAFTNGAVVSLANMIEYFVNYSVGVGHFQAGPYDSRAQALIALESIKSQPSVSNAWLGRSRFYYRKLITRAA